MTRPWKFAAEEVQLASIRESLEKTGGNIIRAAADVGVHRSHASRLLKKYGLVKFAAELRAREKRAASRDATAKNPTRRKR